MGVADAEYKFIYFDVGAYGSENDSTVFRDCSFGRKLFNMELQLPEGRKVAGRETPFMFLADDAFPLHRNIMKPYTPKKGQLFSHLSDSQRIFNYRYEL
jgi:hypothetical protein